MYGLDNASGVNVMPKLAPVGSATPLWFTEGGAGLAASYPGQDWFNMVQAELLAVLTAGGVKPEKGKLNQLAEAINKIIASGKFVTGTELANALSKKQDSGSYADGDKYVSISSQCSIKPSDAFGLIVQGSGVIGIWSNEANNWLWNFSAKGTLVSGNVPFERLTGVTLDANGFVRTGGVTALIRDDVLQVVGTSTTKLMSQKAVTDLVATHGLGYGQKVTNVTASRVPGTVYTNSTLKPIFVNIVHMGLGSNISGNFSVYVDDVVVARSTKGDITHTMSFIVPAGAKYRVEDTLNTGIEYWSELR
ncbi:hypothetical protein QVM88_14255 [Providencia stuartii]|uniref:hypothetical protein n=1 Tax=Providencia stuartii TaxID=588 RepID=UPI0025AB3D7C|nr:hypothetical protein [Providencia stuartii]MDN0007492.1 hypothetical protein [Providencia stuartii]